ncbi:MAG: TetR family transcriptional regulator [Archangiaceae bacterium]|nr:TetR family transcriptional regulator [Archangiaceae bacterium]
MARTSGSRNADYDEQRLALARKLRASLIQDDGLRASMRQLAEDAGTSVATLKHYFKDRLGMLEAVMQTTGIDGAPYMARAAIPTTADVRGSLIGFIGSIKAAWVQFQVGKMHAAMLAEGLAARALGPDYVSHMLEPLLQTGERFLQRHIDAGRMSACDVRQANLMLLAPVVMALLHQDSLGGVACRPLDVDAFITAHVDAFLRAWPPTPRQRVPAAKR